MTEEVFLQVLNGIRESQAPLAYFQPKFIVDQVLASCKFEGIEPQFTTENIDDALANLFIKKTNDKIANRHEILPPDRRANMTPCTDECPSDVVVAAERSEAA